MSANRVCRELTIDRPNPQLGQKMEGSIPRVGGRFVLSRRAYHDVISAYIGTKVTGVCTPFIHPSPFSLR